MIEGSGAGAGSVHCKDKIPNFRNKYSQERNIGAGFRSQFPLSCVCERFIYYHGRSAYSAGGNMKTDPGTIKIAHRHMNVEIGAEAALFPEKEYIRGFSLQCISYKWIRIRILGGPKSKNPTDPDPQHRFREWKTKHLTYGHKVQGQNIQRKMLYQALHCI